jgi:integrase/recombinase XerD
MPRPKKAKAARRRSGEDSNLFLRGNTYWCRYLVSGHERRVSLRTTDVTKAQKERDALLAAARDERAGIEPPPPPPAEKLWQDAAGYYLLLLQGKVASGLMSAGTAKRYRGSIKILSHVFHNQPLSVVDTDTILGFVADRLAEGSTVSTVRNDITALCRVMAAALTKKMVDKNRVLEFDRKENIRAIDKPLHPPTDEEVLETVEAVREWSPAMSKLMIWLRETGMRLAEALAVRREDVHLDGLQVTLRLGVKRGRIRTIPLGRATALLADMPEKGRLFPDLKLKSLYVSSKFGQWRRQREGRLIRELEAAGREPVLLRRWRLHDLRHAFAVASMVDDDTCIYRLSKHLGHTKIGTTEIYIKHMEGEGAQAADFRREDLYGSLPRKVVRARPRRVA